MKRAIARSTDDGRGRQLLKAKGNSHILAYLQAATEKLHILHGPCPAYGAVGFEFLRLGVMDR